MNRTRSLTALALAAALASALPAAAASTPGPRAAAPAAAPSFLQEALTWLATLWDGGSPQKAVAPSDSGGGLDPNGTPKTVIPIHPPVGPQGAGGLLIRP